MPVSIARTRRGHVGAVPLHFKLNAYRFAGARQLLGKREK
jgi:hypothetical protein